MAGLPTFTQSVCIWPYRDQNIGECLSRSFNVMHLVKRNMKSPFKPVFSLVVVDKSDYYSSITESLLHATRMDKMPTAECGTRSPGRSTRV
ncbi:hypothetical protein GCM10027027_10820 [Neomicrococcus lactis]